ncbi:MAG: ECF transporter S component [Erysipelotrichaceae bacterium]|nr:ECF transporter S component [Erysipelotrichaceae bacterium]MBP5279048.1 ECF transporter S component [Erysipelotrichaceae bacterium]
MNRTQKLTLSAMFLAIGQILPFITGQIPEIGKMLCPMHFPIMLCGFVCGPQFGAIVGFICPLLRSILFNMPVMYPSAIGMAFELMTYGLVTGLLSEKLGTDSYKNIYLTLIIAMIAGRLVWGLAQIVLLGIKGNSFTFSAFMSGALINAVPGIILQLIMIPFIVRFLKTRTA